MDHSTSLHPMHSTNDSIRDMHMESPNTLTSNTVAAQTSTQTRCLAISGVFASASEETACTLAHIDPLDALARWHLLLRAPSLLEKNIELNTGPSGVTHLSPLDLLKTEGKRMKQKWPSCDAQGHVFHDIWNSKTGKKIYKRLSRQYIEDQLSVQWTTGDKATGLKELGWERRLKGIPWFQSLDVSRCQVSMLNQFHSGHIATRSYLQSRGKEIKSIVCRLCNEAEETRNHLLSCRTMKLKREEVSVVNLLKTPIAFMLQEMISTAHC